MRKLRGERLTRENRAEEAKLEEAARGKPSRENREEEAKLEEAARGKADPGKSRGDS